MKYELVGITDNGQEWLGTFHSVEDVTSAAFLVGQHGHVNRIILRQAKSTYAIVYKQDGTIKLDIYEADTREDATQMFNEDNSHHRIELIGALYAGRCKDA